MSVAQKASAKPNLRTEFIKQLTVQEKAQRTIAIYVKAILEFITFSKVHSPLKATITDIRAFLFHLKEERSYAARTYNQFFYGLKAFYDIFIPDANIMGSFCRLKTKYCNIQIITRHEFEEMLHYTPTLKHKAMLMLFYGSGIRLSECMMLKLSDINRDEMRLRVLGKGDKQRYTILSHRCLEVLEHYYRTAKKKPVSYIFEGRNRKPMSRRIFEHAVSTAASRAGIKKKFLHIYSGTRSLVTI